MPPRKKVKTTMKSKRPKTPQLPSSSPGDKETMERHQMLVRQMLAIQERGQSDNDAPESPVGSQPNNDLIESPSISQSNNDLAGPTSSSQPNNDLAGPTSSSKLANPIPSLSGIKQPTNAPKTGHSDAPLSNLRSSKKRRLSPASLQTSSSTIQNDDDGSWLGRPVTSKQATVNPPDGTFEIIRIRFLNCERAIQARIKWEDGTTEWVEVESIMGWAKEQLCTAFYKKLLEIADFEQSRTGDEEE